MTEFEVIVFVISLIMAFVIGGLTSDYLNQRKGGDVGMTPSSKELLEMANLEWKNREERKGIHDKISWTSGWISGYLSYNPQAEREKVLDELATFLDNPDNTSDSGNAQKWVSLPVLFKWMQSKGWQT